ncbi:AAA-ATPase At3g50940-like [Olea europaea subsp. europaea]|uniref:AAA-ATPase At3g50940-like n=1 Tax=Olea europaea subsp. europaea TaxID=158383 RepID=A0A8S0R3K5_OLEEU|nr:AAA-ATPase At3g50940-like [Olea europaea subsp. europaea]
MVMEEKNGMARNQIYVAAEVYLHTKINPNTKRHRASKYSKKKKYHSEYFELTFHEQHKETVLNDYLPFVSEKAKEIKEKDRNVKLYTTDCPWRNDDDDGRRGRGEWGYVNLDIHPVTFDKLAMDPDSKKRIIEDLDMFLTLSGLLNLMDGLWSNSGDERIIIFTTNHKEKIDPALLRPGRMVMHIHMSYCTDKGFDVLAYNYLGIEIIQERALEGVMDLLKRKKAEANEEKNTLEEMIKEDEAREEKKIEAKIKEIVKE